jgi:hypothetical protein
MMMTLQSFDGLDLGNESLLESSPSPSVCIHDLHGEAKFVRSAFNFPYHSITTTPKVTDEVIRKILTSLYVFYWTHG